ncbi:MAG: response regulator [Desulfofustis sp.]|jgi:two-component system OmpR family response regulator
MSYRIALVEDDPQLQENYVKALEREGYAVTAYAGKAEAVEAFADRLPDLVILDIMLGEEKDAGFELCRHLRTLSPTIPVIFLTARNSDIDRVSGLRLGAWDYLTKDVTTLDFLPARIAAMFRTVEILRSGDNGNENVIEHTYLRIAEARKEVYWRNRPVMLTLTEFWILYSIAQRPGHLKSHEQLMDAASVVVTNNAISAHIKRIRDKFREIDPTFNHIRSEYGMGYRWQTP